MRKSIVEIIIGIALLLLPGLLSGQSAADTSLPFSTSSKKFIVTGYLEDLQAIQIQKGDQPWGLTNLDYNRLDLHYYANSNWKFQLGVRNRLFYGDTASIDLLNQAIDVTGDQLGFLSRTLFKGPYYLFNITVDRAFVDYTKGKWEVTVGRQRINWGLNLVWNPNDIFNAYSYFDFNYEERPGSDAVRVQYYVNSTNSAELAYKPGNAPGETTAAGLYRFTKGSYDFQVLAGIMLSDYVVGGGWSGILGKAGFNGELTTFIPRNDNVHPQTVVAASVGVNYTFPSSLYLHGAYLLNSAGAAGDDSLVAGLLLTPITAKTLSPSRNSIFGEGAYQFSPLIRGDLSIILDPSDGSFFVGPFLTVSLTNTVQWLTGAQLFFGSKNSVYGNYGQAIYLRIKWSF